jgi:hypothetical protein
MGRSSIYLSSLNSAGVNPIVVGVGASKAHKELAFAIFGYDDEAVVVAFYIENNAVVADKAGTPIIGTNVCGCAPMGTASDRIPRPQRLFGVGMFCPKQAQGPQRNDVHGNILSRSLLGSNLQSMQMTFAVLAGTAARWETLTG